MTRDEFLRILGPLTITGELPPELGVPRQDSRTVQPGDVFFALPGLRFQGIDFAGSARASGASAIVGDTLAAVSPMVLVPDVREAYGRYASAYYGHPSHTLRVVGVTGTNGKTTTVHLLQGILRAASLRTATIGTLGIRTDENAYVSTGYTTPLPENLHASLRQLVNDGVEAVAMEVSSQGLDMGRHTGVRFAGALFTNLTPEHLDYHGTMDAYRRAKMRLFAELSPAAWAGANLEDPSGPGMLAATPPDCLRLGYGVAAGDVHATDVELSAGGTRFRLHYAGEQVTVRLPLVGRYNLENGLCAATGAIAMGIALETIARGLGNPPRVPGRMERTTLPNGVDVLIDYAHTPDGFAKVFSAVRAVTTGRIITVFGCGGDRDQAKRPTMGEIAARMSDHLILTTDNPRSEDPEAIAREVATGIRDEDTWEFTARREEAIAQAVAMANPGDTVLLLGKGAESYQIIGQDKIPYSEHAVVQALAAAYAQTQVPIGPDP